MRESLVKAAAFQALRLSGLLAWAEARARGVPILAYHGVAADEPGPRGALHNRRRLHVPRTLFAAHLRLLVERRQPIALSHLLACLAEGRPLPPRAVVLTFDDGYRNVLTQALPLLREHGLPATVFVVTGDEGRPFWQDRVEAALEATSRRTLVWGDYTVALDTPRARERATATFLGLFEPLDVAVREELIERLIDALGGPGSCDDDERTRLGWDELRALRDAGLEIGSHSARHEPLTLRRGRGAANALAESRQVLARELGTPPTAFSYPYGARNAAVAAAAREAGFVCGLTGDPRLVRAGADPFHLGRFLVGADDDLLRLRASLSGLRGRWQRDPWPPRA